MQKSINLETSIVDAECTDDADKTRYLLRFSTPPVNAWEVRCKYLILL